MISHTQTPKRIIRQTLIIGLVITSLFIASASNAQVTSNSIQPIPTPLRWAPPELDNPTVINVKVSGNHNINLDGDKDYILNMPDSPVTEALAIVGGRNVVMIGGEIDIPNQGKNATRSSRTGIKIKNSKGIIHIEGILIYGEDLSEGIQISAPNAIIQIQNVRIEDIHAHDQVNFTDNHPDLIQPYGNVTELRIDHFTGSTDYQGFMLKADYNGALGTVKISNANIIGRPTARYLIWFSNVPTAGDVTFENVYLDLPSGSHGSIGNAVWPHDRKSYPNQAQVINTADCTCVTWPPEMRPQIIGYLQEGLPPQGDYVKQGQVGIGYSPVGYSGGSVGEIVLINKPPQVTSPGDQVSIIGMPIALQIQGSDPENETLIYHAIDLPEGLHIDQSTGLITGTVTMLSNHNTSIVVIDEQGQPSGTTYNWSILENPDNIIIEPPINLAPVVMTPMNQSTTVGTFASLAIQADDPENTALSYSAAGLPDGLQIDFTSGVISGTPTSSGQYDVELMVYDNEALGSPLVSFTWMVNEQPSSSPLSAPTSNNLAVVALTLINADTNNDIMALTNGATIYLDSLPTLNLNVRADVTSDVNSLKFQLNNGQSQHTENKAPFTLKGDNNGNYKAWTPTVGEYTLAVTGYSGSKVRGQSSQPLIIMFTVAQQSNSTVVVINDSDTGNSNTNTNINTSDGGTATNTSDDGTATNTTNNSGMTVTKFILVNADTNQDIMQLTNSTVIDLNTLPTKNLNIRAETSGQIKSVKFTGSKSGTENSAPYALAGDLKGDYKKWTPSTGNVTITATPYTKANGKGNAGAAMTVSFTVNG